MSELLPLYGVCFILAYVVNQRSVYDYGSEQYIYKNRIWFLVLAAVAVLFAGLRTSYNDTATYIGIYNNISLKKGLLDGFSWELSEHPGFYLVCRVMKYLGISAQSFIMLTSLFTIGVQLWFIRKYSNNTGFGIFLFFMMGCFGFSMAAIKQCVAIAICLIAVDQLIRGRVLLFIVFVLLSATCHPFSLMFLGCLFLGFRPWSQYTYILILIGIIAGVSMQNWLIDALDLVSVMGLEYTEENLVGEGVNFFRVAVLWSPVIISFLVRKNALDADDYVQNLMINLMTVNALIMFIALFGNPVYFGRLANYFLIFQAVGTTYLLRGFNLRSRVLVIIIMIVLYFGYS